jgi:hypothetical protein
MSDLVTLGESEVRFQKLNGTYHYVDNRELHQAFLRETKLTAELIDLRFRIKILEECLESDRRVIEYLSQSTWSRLKRWFKR